jgi:hypothetical protein
MSNDVRSALPVLSGELNFLEQGGYDQVEEGAAPAPFLNSPTCLNFNVQLRPHACHECLLYDFVPAEKRVEDVPCHHIPLNADGATVATMLERGDRAALKQSLREWLLRTMAAMEKPE